MAPEARLCGSLVRLEGWRKFHDAMIVDYDLKSWSVVALNAGKRSWLLRHWFTKTPILAAD